MIVVQLLLNFIYLAFFFFNFFFRKRWNHCEEKCYVIISIHQYNSNSYPHLKYVVDWLMERQGPSMIEDV
jgi:hypothetical protein